jgi:hypothetical protein
MVLLSGLGQPSKIAVLVENSTVDLFACGIIQNGRKAA